MAVSRKDPTAMNLGFGGHEEDTPVQEKAVGKAMLEVEETPEEAAYRNKETMSSVGY